MRVSIAGDKKIVELLDLIDTIQEKRGFRDALAEGALVVVADAKDRAPVLTGALKRHLHVGGYTKLTPEYRRIGRYGALPGPKGQGRNVRMRIGTTLPYAHLVEYGTRHSRAKPFLRPALDSRRGEMISVVRRKMDKIIK
jgi:HK97 gp10 family phage protein